MSALGQKRNILGGLRDVRFTPESELRDSAATCPLWAARTFRYRQLLAQSGCPRERLVFCFTAVNELEPLHSAAESSADRFTRVSPLTLSTVTCVSYQVSRGRAPKRSVSSVILASVNHASAASRLSHR